MKGQARAGGFRSWSTWSLRTRLLVTTTVMLAVVAAGIACAATLFLRADLVNSAGNRLDQAMRHSADPHQPGVQGGLSGGLGFVTMPWQAQKSIGAWIHNGAVVSAGINEPDSASVGSFPYPAIPLSDSASASLAALAGGASREQVSVPGQGDYLFDAERMPNGDTIVLGVPLSEADGIVSQLIVVEAVITVAGLIVAGFLSFALIRLSLRPLDRVAATAVRISRLPLHEGEVGELIRVPEADTDIRTEAGQVGSSLNRLIDHVSDALAARHASETRVRQFVADASHELRTPLASIAGYAELTRRGRETVPPDTAYALSRVESEAARMTRLVEDLLLLARLDAGRPLEREPMDLSPLVVDAVRDAHAATPDHDWQVQLPDEPATVDGDPHRLHQVLVNLLANAGKHTPPGTTVTASVVPGPGVCELRIADNGPGIPPELLPTVFERFARGDSSRSRAAGSTGLGLAIVAAVASSHGGEVSVGSVPGRTVFTVRLPAATAPAPAPQPALTN